MNLHGDARRRCRVPTDTSIRRRQAKALCVKNTHETKVINEPQIAFRIEEQSMSIEVELRLFILVRKSRLFEDSDLIQFLVED